MDPHHMTYKKSVIKRQVCKYIDHFDTLGALVWSCSIPGTSGRTKKSSLLIITCRKLTERLHKHDK